jgi:hypothetical protein
MFGRWGSFFCGPNTRPDPISAVRLLAKASAYGRSSGPVGHAAASRGVAGSGFRRPSSSMRLRSAAIPGVPRPAGLAPRLPTEMVKTKAVALATKGAARSASGPTRGHRPAVETAPAISAAKE